MDNNISSKKLALIQWLIALEDEALMQQLFQLREESMQAALHIINEAEKESIGKGIADAGQGKLNTHESAQLIYKR